MGAMQEAWKVVLKTEAGQQLLASQIKRAEEVVRCGEVPVTINKGKVNVLKKTATKTVNVREGRAHKAAVKSKTVLGRASIEAMYSQDRTSARPMPASEPNKKFLTRFGFKETETGALVRSEGIFIEIVREVRGYLVRELRDRLGNVVEKARPMWE